MDPQAKYQVQVTPKFCQGDGAAYSGVVTMKMLTVFERNDLVERFAVAMDSDPDSILAASIAKAVDEKILGTVRMGRFLQRNVGKFVVGVDLTRKEDGFKLTSFDDILYEAPIAERCVTELGYWLLRPTRLGNSSSPS